MRRNVCQAHLSGQPYTFSFNGALYAITMRRGGQSGEIVHVFDSNSAAEDVQQLIRALVPADECHFHPGGT